MDINEITELTDAWCRMWSVDPALAHDVMTEDCRQWSGNTAGLDGVIGPQQQQEFVTAYRAEHVNVFTPRLIIAEADSFGYLWDVARPDGSVVTGIDVNVLQGRRVRQNWTFVADTWRSQPDPEPGAACRADELTGLLEAWVAEQGFAVHRQPVLDPDNGRIALLRSTTAGLGGVDLLSVRGGAVESIWSVTGVRPFHY